MIPGCGVGFLERPERVVTVILGLLLGNPHVALLVLAVLGNLIAVQRILFTRATLAGRPPEGKFGYWIYPRGSAEHTALSVLIILFLIFGHHLIPLRSDRPRSDPVRWARRFRSGAVRTRPAAPIRAAGELEQPPEAAGSQPRRLDVQLGFRKNYST